MVRQVVDSALLPLKPGLGGEGRIRERADREGFPPVQGPGLEGQADTVAVATWVCKTLTRKEMSGRAARAIQARLPTTDLKAVRSCAVTGSVLLRLARICTGRMTLMLSWTFTVMVKSGDWTYSLPQTETCPLRPCRCEMHPRHAG